MDNYVPFLLMTGLLIVMVTILIVRGIKFVVNNYRQEKEELTSKTNLLFLTQKLKIGGYLEVKRGIIDAINNADRRSIRLYADLLANSYDPSNGTLEPEINPVVKIIRKLSYKSTGEFDPLSALCLLDIEKILDGTITIRINTHGFGFRPSDCRALEEVIKPLVQAINNDKQKGRAFSIGPLKLIHGNHVLDFNAPYITNMVILVMKNKRSLSFIVRDFFGND